MTPNDKFQLRRAREAHQWLRRLENDPAERAEIAKRHAQNAIDAAGHKPGCNFAECVKGCPRVDWYRRHTQGP